MTARVAALLGVLAAVPSAAAAQPEPRFSFGAGIVWTAGYSGGDSRATETSNPGVSPSRLLLFSASARSRAVPGLAAHVGWRLSRALAIEAEGQLSRPALDARLAQDFENAPATTATQTFTQVLAGGSLIYRLRVATRVVPFLAGGGGFLRRVAHDASTAETSSEFHAGGGVQWSISRHVGVRGDARLSSLSRAIGFHASRRYVPQVLGTIVLSP